MFIDARELPDGGVLSSDLCVIGAGAAGISIALELIGSGLDVLLLESGGLEPDRETQALYEGENIGFKYYALDRLRSRYFGGTTADWAGVCRPLDEIDFVQRAWVPGSGWPFDAQALTRWYMRAHEICEIGLYDYEPDGWEQAGPSRLHLRTDRIATQMFQLSPPTRFGERYRQDLERAGNVRVCLWANATELSTTADGTRIESVAVRTLDGARTSVKAKHFVLATGALENARLLLNSRQGDRQGIGNSHDSVGRYFMEHLAVDVALLIPSDPGFNPRLYTEHTRRPADGIEGKGFFVLRDDVQQSEQLLNGRVFLREIYETQFLRADYSRSVEATRALRDALFGRSTGEARLGSHLQAVLGSFDDIMAYTYQSVLRKPGRERYLALNCHIEQAPDRSSRVMLSEQRDPFGQPRLKLDWQFGELERRTFSRSCELLGEAFGEAGIGRIRMLDTSAETGWLPGLRGAWHQMGTTRMSPDARSGVVDANCRVHEVENLYVAGGSVFPTSGYTNSMLPLVALAARLADELRRVS